MPNQTKPFMIKKNENVFVFFCFAYLFVVVDLLEPSGQLRHFQIFLLGLEGLHLLDDDRNVDGVILGRRFFVGGLGDWIQL